MTDGLGKLVGFARALRRRGVNVTTSDVMSLCAGVAVTPPLDLYWVGRATLLSAREQIPIYDEVFASFFATAEAGIDEADEVEEATVESVAVAVEAGDGVELVRPERAVTSEKERLLHKSLAACDEADLRVIGELMLAVARHLPVRRDRRRRRARTGVPDPRATMRAMMRTTGEPLVLHRRQRSVRPRPVVLFLDVSGSMEPYSRGLLLFAYAMVRAHPVAEAFAFGTRLTRLTPALASARTPDAALNAVAGRVVDWEGGTRIGASLKGFLSDRQAIHRARDAIIFIASDGLEIGDPDDLRAAVDRLGRIGRRLVWLNPLKEDPCYEPTARGMAAVLPHVDLLAGGHTLGDLRDAVANAGRI